MRTLHPTLIGFGIRIEPSRIEHADQMLTAADPETFSLFTVQPTPWNAEGCRTYLRALLEHPSTHAFSVFDERTGALVGGTSYCDIRPQHRGVEIGWTWITPPMRGSHVNPAMKLLLLRQAFESPLFPAGPAIRVALKTHHLNRRSQAAIRKLGAVYEGTLRRHVIMPDGSLRNTVMFSITADEWPTVRDGLLARLR